MLIFAEGEKPDKNPRSKGENQQQTQLTCDFEYGNRTRDIVVRGKRSRRYATHASFKSSRIYIHREKLITKYLPITNIAYLSKVLERVVATQLMSCLLENDLLAKFQSAYRNFYSTETCLVRVTNDIIRAIDRQQEVVLVLLDFSSAFGTIDHTALSEGLKKTIWREWYCSRLVQDLHYESFTISRH
jgi:hypothetical protein